MRFVGIRQTSLHQKHYTITPLHQTSLHQIFFTCKPTLLTHKSSLWSGWPGLIASSKISFVEGWRNFSRWGITREFLYVCRLADAGLWLHNNGFTVFGENTYIRGTTLSQGLETQNPHLAYFEWSYNKIFLCISRPLVTFYGHLLV
jgi:hypothetical protein